MEKKTNTSDRLKELIQEYLLEEGVLREKINDQKLDFGFQFVFPGGTDPQGRQKGRPFTVTKPKNKNIIEIGCPTVISPEHGKKLEKEDKKQYFFSKLQKYLLTKNFLFNLDGKNNRYVIIDNIYPRKDGYISKDMFFRRVRDILTSTIYSIIMLKEICDNVMDLGEWEIK